MEWLLTYFHFPKVVFSWRYSTINPLLCLDSLVSFLAITVAPGFTLWLLVSLMVLGDAPGFSELSCLLQIPGAPSSNILLTKLCLCHSISQCPPPSLNRHCLFGFHPTELTRTFPKVLSSGSNGGHSMCSCKEMSPKPNDCCLLETRGIRPHLYLIMGTRIPMRFYYKLTSNFTKCFLKHLLVSV